MNFLQRRIHLITGKGGVGRTTVAVAMARAAARHGRRVLLCEIGDPEGGYSAIGRRFGFETLTPTPVELAPGILGCHLWGPTGHEEFLRSVLPARALIRAALRSRALSRFLSAAPSFHEMGVFNHLLTLLEAKEKDGSPTHEMMIVDMPATGHTLALTGLTEILLRLVPSGPVAAALHLGRSHITDPAKCASWVVTLPEQLPVSEALELLQGLEANSHPVGGVILNRFPDDPFSPEENAALEEWLAHTPMHGETAWRRIESSRDASKRLAGAISVPIWNLPELQLAQGELDQSLAKIVFQGSESSL